ncbi:50S ribosomal protein L18 [Thermosulfuriphilus sp.]
MVRTNKKLLARLRRKKRIRKKIFGTAERPRLCVFRSAKHIYAQIINDEEGRTLVAASTLSKDLRERLLELKGQGKVALAKAVGEHLAKLAKEKGITKVCFDRGGYRYHGRVRALAEGAREGGLEF